MKKLTTEEFEEEEVPFAVKGTQRVGSSSDNVPELEDGLVTWKSHMLFPLSSLTLISPEWTGMGSDTTIWMRTS